MHLEPCTNTSDTDEEQEEQAQPVPDLEECSDEELDDLVDTLEGKKERHANRYAQRIARPRRSATGPFCCCAGIDTTSPDRQRSYVSVRMSSEQARALSKD